MTQSSIPRPHALSGVLLSMILCILLLQGCSSALTKDPTIDWSAAETYQNANDELKDGNYTRAIEYYEKLEARYPFGEYAQQAQLETIYAYFKSDDQESALSAADRFIKLHPKHSRVDYAYYMRGLASASKISVPLDNIFEQDPAERDPSSTRESFNYFADLARAFPDSPYTPDAIERMKGLKNTLAAHELVVADYYMRREAYVAAADRAKYVVEYFNESTAVPHALGIMVKAYRELHMADLADDTLKVLQLNYPDELEEMELEPEG